MPKIEVVDVHDPRTGTLHCIACWSWPGSRMSRRHEELFTQPKIFPVVSASVGFGAPSHSMPAECFGKEMGSGGGFFMLGALCAPEF